MNRKNFFSDYLNFFDNPQTNGQYIHVAGTKGKTSTSYYIYEMLLRLEKSVGLFISPHIFSERERIQKNGEYLSHENLSYYKEKIEEAKRELSYPLGFFEEYLLIAFLFFRDNPVEYVVLEVGIGGLYDTTNVITPHVSVVARIKKDHQEVLGYRLWEIAEQKLGIIKPGRAFIIGRQNFWVSLYIFGKTRAWRYLQIPLRTMKTLAIYGKDIYVKLDGNNLLLQGPLYMRENFLLAYSVVSYLGYSWNFPTFVHDVPGRMQAIEGYSRAFLDGAHNELAARVLVKSLRRQFPGQTWKILLCIRKDKDISGVIRQLKKIADLFIFCRWDLEIKEDYNPHYAIQVLEKQKCSYKLVEKESLCQFLGVDDSILVTGSFYHLALVSAELSKRFI